MHHVHISDQIVDPSILSTHLPNPTISKDCHHCHNHNGVYLLGFLRHILCPMYTTQLSVGQIDQRWCLHRCGAIDENNRHYQYGHRYRHITHANAGYMASSTVKSGSEIGDLGYVLSWWFVSRI